MTGECGEMEGDGIVGMAGGVEDGEGGVFLFVGGGGEVELLTVFERGDGGGG